MQLDFKRKELKKMDTNIKDLDNNFSFRINKDKKQKAIIILKTKGKDLSTHLREIIYQLAEEYDKKNNS
jgi:hypothetical protein